MRAPMKGPPGMLGSRMCNKGGEGGVTNNGHPPTLASRATSSPSTTSTSYSTGGVGQRARRRSRQRVRGSPARACAPTAVATPARQPAARRAARSTGPRRRAYIPPFSGAVLDSDGRGRHGGACQAPQPRVPGCARAMKRPVGARRSSSGIRWPLPPPTHPTRHRCNRYASAQEMKCGCVSYVQVGLAPVTKGVPLQGTAHREKRKDAYKKTTRLHNFSVERTSVHANTICPKKTHQGQWAMPEGARKKKTAARTIEPTRGTRPCGSLPVGSGSAPYAQPRRGSFGNRYPPARLPPTQILPPLDMPAAFLSV